MKLFVTIQLCDLTNPRPALLFDGVPANSHSRGYFTSSLLQRIREPMYHGSSAGYLLVYDAADSCTVAMN
jgi:hypothetical protein